MKKLLSKARKNTENLKSEYDMQLFFEIASEDEIKEYSTEYSVEVVKRVLQNRR